jgi:hypothetical protein
MRQPPIAQNCIKKDSTKPAPKDIIQQNFAKSLTQQNGAKS